jgi:hypothetical protein
MQSMSRRRVLSVVAAAAATLAWLVPAGTTLAAQRWVAPVKQGLGDCSSQANAGTIQEGFGTCGGVAASKGDEIVVTPGNYSVTATLTAPESGSVHGLAGSPRPTIDVPSSAAPFTSTLNASTAQVSDLALQNDVANSTALTAGPLVENVTATATGKEGSAISGGGNALVRDSLAETTGSGGIALNDQTGSMRAQNVTAFSTGPGSYGIRATSFGFEIIGPPCFGSSGQVTAENVIAHGAADDVATVNTGSCLPIGPLVSISLDYSNFQTMSANPPATIHDSGHNQESSAQTTPTAIFVAPYASPPDLHERTGAPTIDSGIANMLGPTDPDGNSRTLGAAPDIGAFEFVPPTPIPVQTTGGKTTPTPATFTISGAAHELADGSLEFALEATGPGSLTGTATTTLPAGKAAGATGKKHKKRHPRSRTLLYGSGTATATGPGTVKLLIKPTATGARVLRKRKHLNLKITIAFKPTTGPVVEKTTSATVKAPPRHKKKRR